ncbi:MAG: UPF0175 family protein [candidate division NC10 bacterium]|nr:UPF0175 family protein [candidate division NC10 bacterium]
MLKAKYKLEGGTVPKILRIEWELLDEAFSEGFEESTLVAAVKEEAALHLLKEGRISQGKTVELLSISRHDLFDLMATYDIPVTGLSPEEMKQEFEQADELFVRKWAGKGRFQKT